VNPGVYSGLLLGTNLVWFLLETWQSAKDRPEAVRADRRGIRALVLGVAVGFGVAVLLSRLVPAARIHGAWVGGLALGLMWSGIALRVWSFRTLGRYFTFVIETSADQPVIDKGPYRLLRHPSYTGLLLAIAGLSVVMGNWLSSVALIAGSAWGLVIRIGVEERALVQALGSRYLEFAATRKRLVPYVW
jgi:protein-S-isoprenylcysteine O-methyltransferase Ste14